MTLRRRGRPRLLRSERYTRRLLRSLLNLYQHLRTPKPLDELFQAILATALDGVPGAQRGSLLVVEGEHLCYRATVGYDLALLGQVGYPAQPFYDELRSGRRATQGWGCAGGEGRSLCPEAAAILREQGHSAQIRRSLVTVIVVGDQFYGTLALDNLRSHPAFPPEAEALAQRFAAHAGKVIEQALLLDQVRHTSALQAETEKLAAMGRFISSIAHEINNPLTAVLGYSDFLAAAGLSAEAGAMLEQLRVGAERVRAIVRNLQLFARQQRQGAGNVNLNFLSEQTIALKRSDLNLDQIEVALALDPDLPFTWGDGGQLSQVLLNLIANAQQALRQVAPPRRLELQTALAAGAAGSLLTLRVADSGPGVAPALVGRIFEPFFTTRAAGQGPGLGLSICQEIVRAHGGQIRHEAWPGGGAVFVVELPLRTGPPQREEIFLPAAAAQTRPRDRAVLLIEDDPAVVDVVLRALDAANEVVVAANGREALRIVAAQRFDLALCDLRMPEMDGLELFERLRADHPDLAGRLIFISGDTSSPATYAALKASGRPVLAKPFTPDELFAAMAAIV